MSEYPVLVKVWLPAATYRQLYAHAQQHDLEVGGLLARLAAAYQQLAGSQAVIDAAAAAVDEALPTCGPWEYPA